MFGTTSRGIRLPRRGGVVVGLRERVGEDRGVGATGDGATSGRATGGGTAGRGTAGGAAAGGGGEDSWAAAADDWAALWGRFTDPARRALLAATGAGPGTRLLDVGCGTGELLALAAAAGLDVRGADASPAMVAHARRAAAGADVRVAPAEALPWPDASVDVVAFVNVLALTDDYEAALAEARRVLVPGGLVAVCGWAEREHNDLHPVHVALAAAAGDESEDDDEDPWHEEAPVAGALTDAGFTVEHTALVEVPWTVPDADGLVRAVLLGEDPAGLAERGPVVRAAAERFRTADGGYRFAVAARLLVGRAPRA